MLNKLDYDDPTGIPEPDRYLSRYKMPEGLQRRIDVRLRQLRRSGKEDRAAADRCRRPVAGGGKKHPSPLTHRTFEAWA